ncbi:MAG: glycosyltransferase family 2 protein [Firmicutes bacterium]|nr:glycosyltransferase family 2 protein [Bacillota bacterium]
MISAVVPAFNEAKTIKKTVLALAATGQIDEIIVVDDGSGDDTAQRALSAGAHVISLAQNQGKAGALAIGVREARGEILCFADADLGESAIEFRHLIAPVAAGQVDMTVAIFPPAKSKGGFGLVKKLAVLGVGKLGGYKATAPLSGQRVLRRQVWEAAAPALTGFGVEVGLTVECLRHGFTLRELPVQMYHRETGRDWAGFCHRGRQFRDLLLTFWSLWLKGGVKA